MDQVKIGKFISEKRKENNITQSELAEKLNVTNKSVSNWENGKNMPDVSLMKDLCSILGISLIELFNGEQTSSDDGLINYLKEEKKRKRKKLIISITVILLIIIVSTLLIFFVNNYNKVNAYILYGDSENFEYHDDLLILSNIKNINKSGRLDIKNKSINSSDVKCVTLKYKDRTITGYCGNTLGGIAYEDDGYDEYFPEDVKKHIDEWYIEVKYMQNDIEKKEIIKLKSNHILTNSRIFYKKVEPISNGEDTSEFIKARNEYFKSVWDELLNNRGFKDSGVFDIKGNPKKGVLLNKTVDGKYIKYHHDSYMFEISDKNEHHMYANLRSQFVHYDDGTGKSYVYDMLKDQVIKCNGKKCTTIDSETEKIIQEYKSIILKEFDGLLNFNPNARYIDPNDDEDM